jgi:hypothetical protein
MPIINDMGHYPILSWNKHDSLMNGELTNHMYINYHLQFLLCYKYKTAYTMELYTLGKILGPLFL